jgi:hypothetical protein
MMAELPQLTPLKKGGIIALEKYAKWSCSQLAGKFRRSVPTVKGIIRHYYQYGNVYDRYGPGRHPRLDQAARERLARAVKRDPKKSSKYRAKRINMSRSKRAGSSRKRASRNEYAARSRLSARQTCFRGRSGQRRTKELIGRR